MSAMYDFSVPAIKQTLGALAGLVDKAAAHCEAKKIEPEALIHARLYPDMYAFNRQIVAVIWQAVGGIARLRGTPPPPRPTSAPDSFPALKSALLDAIAAIESVKPAELEGSENREVIFEIPGRTMPFVGRDWLTSFVMPNFYFHATTAYDILRHNGVELGKRDFLGQLRLKT